MKESEGDSWYIITTLVIFFFLFQWFEIYSITTVMQCNKLSDFWIPYPQKLDNPFYMVIYIFSLLFLWSMLDAIRSVYFNCKDKVFASVVFVFVTIFSVLLARCLWAQWELMEIENGFLITEESIFLNEKVNIFKLPKTSHRQTYYEQWEEFIRLKKCESPMRKVEANTEEDWIKLEDEFISQGGYLPWR